MNNSKRNNSEKTKRKLYDEANKESMTRDQTKEQQLNFPHERPKSETILKYYNGII